MRRDLPPKAILSLMLIIVVTKECVKLKLGK